MNGWRGGAVCSEAALSVWGSTILLCSLGACCPYSTAKPRQALGRSATLISTLLRWHTQPDRARLAPQFSNRFLAAHYIPATIQACSADRETETRKHCPNILGEGHQRVAGGRGCKPEAVEEGIWGALAQTQGQAGFQREGERMGRWRHWERSVAMVEGAGLCEPELKACQRHRSGTARPLGPKERVCRKCVRGKS